MRFKSSARTKTQLTLNKEHFDRIFTRLSPTLNLTNRSESHRMMFVLKSANLFQMLSASKVGSRKQLAHSANSILKSYRTHLKYDNYFENFVCVTYPTTAGSRAGEWVGNRIATLIFWAQSTLLTFLLISSDNRIACVHRTAYLYMSGESVAVSKYFKTILLFLLWKCDKLNMIWRFFELQPFLDFFFILSFLFTN